MSSDESLHTAANRRQSILFADDHQIVLDALTYLVKDEYDAQAVDTLAALNSAMPTFHPDLIVLDIFMPDGDGIEAARQLLQKHPDLKILFLSMQHEPQLVKRAMETGAMGYVSKHASGDELLLALRTVLNGGKYIGARSERHPGDVVHPDGDVLTERQKEVLTLIAQGCSAKEIANRLNISVRTAEFHRAAIMERLKLHSTAMMTRYAVEHGLA